MGNLTRSFAGLITWRESFSLLSFGSGYTEIVAGGKNNKLNFSREFQSESRATIHLTQGFP
jgi:hypothetical protein